MTYKTIMIEMNLGLSNEALLKAAAMLVERTTAIGIAACQPMTSIVADGYVASDIFEMDRQELKKR